jgi:hypothetical protein
MRKNMHFYAFPGGGMIRSRAALERALEEGRAVSLQHPDKGCRPRLAASDTNETVWRSALRRLVDDGKAVPARVDLVGEAVEWVKA